MSSMVQCAMDGGTRQTETYSNLADLTLARQKSVGLGGPNAMADSEQGSDPCPSLHSMHSSCTGLVGMETSVRGRAGSSRGDVPLDRMRRHRRSHFPWKRRTEGAYYGWTGGTPESPEADRTDSPPSRATWHDTTTGSCIARVLLATRRAP